MYYHIPHSFLSLNSIIETIKHLPHISILIPARNEAENLPTLFRSLEALDYPKEKMEVLLGNDQSDDDTAVLMDNFSKEKPWVKVLHLKQEEDDSLKGKARVLDKLADLASGDYLFFTDADIELPPKWIAGILTAFKENVGVVIGTTGFKKMGLWSTLQGTEWLMALNIFSITAKWGIPSTGLGNNMAVSKEAYQKIGGYKKLGFSIVEDYQLYIQIIKAGFGFRHVFKPEVLAYTVPPKNYFEQRKRWIKGAMENAPWAMLGGILQALCIPILLVLLLISWKIPLVVICVLLLVYAWQITSFERKLNLKGYLKFLPFFALYISGAWFLQFMYFIFARNTVWKGRRY